VGSKIENQGHGEKMSRKRELLLAAILQCENLDQAAKAAGVGYTTARRWCTTDAEGNDFLPHRLPGEEGDGAEAHGFEGGMKPPGAASLFG